MVKIVSKNIITDGVTYNSKDSEIQSKSLRKLPIKVSCKTCVKNKEKLNMVTEIIGGKIVLKNRI